jgi:hypothetical protein
MIRMKHLWKVAWLLALLALLVTGALGVYNAFQEWPNAETALQKSVSAGELVYGLTGLVAAFGLLRRRRWSLRWAAVWGLAATYTGGTAVLAYGGADATLGAALWAWGGGALVAAAVVWAVHASLPADASDVAEPTISV